MDRPRAIRLQHSAAVPQLLADRFASAGGQWVDLATGTAVRMRVAPAGSLRAQLEWNSRCAALASLRHPAINPLIDYGMADAEHSFEAYLPGQPIRADAGTATRLMNHVVRFLAAHDVYLDADSLAYVLRSIVPGARERLHPFGIALQPRGAFDAIREALQTGLPPGASAVAVAGEPRSGLRTLRVAAARTARLEGYVPVA